jgi:hypothetical protein
MHFAQAKGCFCQQLLRPIPMKRESAILYPVVMLIQAMNP